MTYKLFVVVLIICLRLQFQCLFLLFYFFLLSTLLLLLWSFDFYLTVISIYYSSLLTPPWTHTLKKQFSWLFNKSESSALLRFFYLVTFYFYLPSPNCILCIWGFQKPVLYIFKVEFCYHLGETSDFMFTVKGFSQQLCLSRCCGLFMILPGETLRLYNRLLFHDKL